MWATGAREEALLHLKELNLRLGSIAKPSSKASNDRETTLSQLACRTYLKQGKWISVLNEEWNDVRIAFIRPITVNTLF